MPDILNAAQSSQTPVTPPPPPPVEPPAPPVPESIPEPPPPEPPMPEPTATEPPAPEPPSPPSALENFVVPPPGEEKTPQQSTSTEPVPQATMPAPPPAMKPKKKKTGLVIAGIILMLITVPLIAFFVAKPQSLADLRSLAAGGRAYQQKQIIKLGSNKAQKAAQESGNAGVTCPAGSYNCGTGECCTVGTGTRVAPVSGGSTSTNTGTSGSGGGGTATTPAPILLDNNKYAECLRNSRGIASAVAGCNSSAAPGVATTGNIVVGIRQPEASVDTCSSAGGYFIDNVCYKDNPDYLKALQTGATSPPSQYSDTVGKPCNVFTTNDYGQLYSGDPCAAGTKCSDTTSAGGTCIAIGGSVTNPNPTWTPTSCYGSVSCGTGASRVCVNGQWMCSTYTNNCVGKSKPTDGRLCTAGAEWGCGLQKDGSYDYVCLLSNTSYFGGCAPPSQEQILCPNGTMATCVNKTWHCAFDPNSGVTPTPAPNAPSGTAGSTDPCKDVKPLNCPAGAYSACYAGMQECVDPKSASNPYICANGLACPQGWSCTGADVAGTEGSTFASKYCVQIGAGGTGGGTSGTGGGGSSGGNPPTNAPQCVSIVIYKDGNAMSSGDLSSLQPGQTVTLGYAPGGNATKVRFLVTIDSVTQTPIETSNRDAATSQFRVDYQMGSGTNFSIAAQWFDGTNWNN